jgi:hypothetical protein
MANQSTKLHEKFHGSRLILVQDENQQIPRYALEKKMKFRFVAQLRILVMHAVRSVDRSNFSWKWILHFKCVCKIRQADFRGVYRVNNNRYAAYS